MMDYHVNRKVWQILWEATLGEKGFGYHGEYFTNNTFEYKPYRWDDWDDDVVQYNEYHFWHKPSGFKIQWYKYALRGAYCNMDITDSQFVDILRDCVNSLQPKEGFRVIYDVDKWWENDE